MPSPTDFNLSPYYDDFSEDKKFHRVLFRPAFAVQARELTQSQTQLQNQVERVSDHLFQKGAMIIPGEIGYDLNYYSIKLSAKSNSTLADYNGVELTGATTGLVARVVGVSAADGTDPDTLFVKYSKTGTDNVTTVFSDTETLNCLINNIGATATVASTHTGSAAEVQKGVFYINGYHVEVSTQTIVLDKYTNTPSNRVGVIVTESFVTPNEDASLNDNAQGTSNTNAPGAHRYKILLTLAKKSLTATDDKNFIELLRLSNGILQNRVRTTEYGVLEDTFARRTYDESGNYITKGFELDVREHLLDGNNRGIYASGAGGDSSKLAIGLSPGKAYVKGYEIEKLGTTFVDVDKSRNYDTEPNFKSRFDLGNYINVTKVYGTPDVGFVSGDVETFKAVDLFRDDTAVTGTPLTSSGADVPQIGRAKSKGFEHNTTQAISSGIFNVNGTWKHYLFDIVMFTHLNNTTNVAFTTGETVTGGTSGSTGIVQSITGGTDSTISGATQANPVVITATGHTLKEGQQITISTVAGMTNLNGNVYTVRNSGTDDFELYDTDGTSTINGTGYGAYTSGGTAGHGVVVVSSVSGSGFSQGETITGGTSTNTAVIQANAVGWYGVTEYNTSNIKQIAMAGSPVYVANTSRASGTGENAIVSGTLDVTNANTTVVGINTRFTDELKIGDEISYTLDTGATETNLIKAVISDTSLQLTANAGAAATKTVATRQRGILQSPEKNTSLFKMPYETIKTLKTTLNSGITDTNFAIRRHFTATLSGNGDASITAGTNETFAGLAEKDFSVSIMTIGGGSTGAVGDVLSLTGNNHLAQTIFTLAGSPTGKTLTLNFGTDFAGHKVKILGTVNRSVAGSKTKSLNSSISLQVTTQATIESGTIGLGKADIYKINNVYMAADFATDATSGDTNVSNRFDLDTGQRDNFYDIGRLKLKTGALTLTGRLLIDFDYFSHGSGDYFDVDSYSGVIDYENIPPYESATSGERFELRDTLDFRPRVDDASTINSGDVDRSYDGVGASTIDVVKFGTDITSDFEYYLQRVDKIYLDSGGKFQVLSGASSATPDIPGALDNAMHMYTLFLPSYGISTADVSIESVDNRRYTMRDIGHLERRISNVEYYTQLSLLEVAAQTLQIQDADGFDRFKNGFVVDNFTGHSIGDPGNVDYKVSMDMAKGEMRPTFHEDAIQLVESDGDGTSIKDADRTDGQYQKTGDLITLPFSESTLINQPYASKSINVNPFGIFTWIGSIALTPANDEWKETERAPELTITNDDGTWDTLVAVSGNPNLQEVEIGTVWNEWTNNWTGQQTTNSTEQFEQRGGHGWRVMQRDIQTTTHTGTRTRGGIRQVIVPKTITNSIGDRIISVAFVPFIRSRTVSFTATRMRPNTRVYAFFDSDDISTYVTPDGGSLGGNLVTDANGAVTGAFAIPDPKVNANPRWRTGQRIFRLTSSSTNVLTQAPDTAANAEYIARGIIETVQNTIIATRTAAIEFRATNETENVTRTDVQRGASRQVGYHDPLAQTFMIDDAGGVFLTSMDLYFSSKDANVPLTLQVRNTVNGYPGQNILPFSEVSLNPPSINISDDATVATKFTFSSPVYVQENTEYAFVLMANSTDYNCYVGRLGETVIGSDRTISAQPYAGVMFKSQNGVTWTTEQNEDIKFTLKRAEFENVTGDVMLTNDTLPARTLKLNPLRTINTSGVVRVYHPNHGMHGTSNNVTIAGIPAGTYNGIAHNDLNGTYASISNITLDSYDITTAGTATTTGDVGSNAVIATQNRKYDILNLSGVQTMTLPNTSINWYVRPTTGQSMHGAESEFSLTSKANNIAVVNSENVHFNNPKAVMSGINEINEMSSQKSFWLNLKLTTSNTKVSPILDTQRMSAFVISNRLNNPKVSNTPDFVDDIASTGSSTAAVYLTKPVVLENSSTSLDVRLTSNIRSSSVVRVYHRALGPEDERKIEDLSWTPFNTDGSEDTAIIPAENDTTFREYKYSVAGLNQFTSFQIKIVMKGSISSYPPIVRDMRTIALAV
jgi:hypothetical protein